MTAAPRVVSVIVPCRNELAHMGDFLAGVRAQTLPSGWTVEIVVADGMSDDGTRQAVDAAAAGDPRVVAVDNPGRIVSTGLNRALVASRGEVIVRMDVHTRYAPDYVATCLDAIETTGADVVGGAWHAETASDAGPMAQAIAAAFQSRWVTGGALSRQLDHDGEVDTVYLGAWPRRTFERHGGFDEQLVRNQDDEHNLRIVRGGGTVWQSSRIRSWYRPRAHLGQVFRQYRQYGYWKPFVMRKHRQAAAPRQLAPLALVAALATTAIASLVAVVAGAASAAATTTVALASAAFAFVWGGYALAVVIASAAVARESGLDAAAALRVPAVVAAYHVAYGIGSVAGWLDVLRGRPGDERQATLTR